MKKLVVVAFFAILCNVSFSQKDTIAIFHKADSLNEIGKSLYINGEINDALYVFKQSAEITKEIYDGENDQHLGSIYTIGLIYYRINDYQNSLTYLIPASQILEKYAPTSKDYREILEYIGNIYIQLGDAQNVIKYYTQALNTGIESPDDAAYMAYIGSAYKDLQEYKKAREYLSQAINMLENNNNIYFYEICLLNYGEAINKLNDFQTALIYLEKSREIEENTSGNETEDYAKILNEIGYSYFGMGDAQNALKYYLQALKIRKKVLGEENIDYVTTLNSIGSVYYYMDSLDYALKYFTQVKDILGENHPSYARALSNIASLYSDMGNYKSSLEYYMQAIELEKKSSEEESANYALMINNVGDLYKNMGEYQNALKYHTKALEIRGKVLGEEHPDYVASLGKICTIYIEMGDYQNALKYHLQAIEILKNIIGTEHPDYAGALNNIGLVYNKMGDYQNALKYHTKVLEIRGKILGEEHPDYAASLNNIGNVYNEMGDYQNALKYIMQASEIRGKTLGKGHPDYAMSLNNIGAIYTQIGKNEMALKYYTQAMEIFEKTLGKGHPDYAMSLNNIGEEYTELCEYNTALKYQQQALDIRKKILGENSPEYAMSLGSIGSIYNGMGDYPNALKYYTQALNILKNTLGENHHNYIALLINIGQMYRNLGDYQNALKYSTQAMENSLKTFGNEHPEYAAALNNIGLIYNEMGDYQNALKYYTQAFEIHGKVLGKEHPNYALSLNNIGGIYTAMGDRQNALKYYTQAMDIWKTAFGENHHTQAMALRNIGVEYFLDKNFAEAIKKNKQATDICKNNLIKNFSFMTAHEREAYWNANKDYFSQNINYTYHTPDNTLATKVSYDSELITKGLLLTSEISMTNIIMESGNKALISEYETLKTAHLQLNKELEKPIAERLYNCDSLENEIQKMERHIMENCKDFGDVTHFIKIDWKEVQKSLKPNDVAIEFANFTDLINDTTRYLALVLTKDMDAPVCVPLFEQSEMQKLQRGIATTKPEEPTDDENRGAITVATKKQGIYESTGLYNLLWKPLEIYFPANPRIYFAPSGMLHQIAIEYAPVGEGKLVSDKYEMYRVSSTRYLAMDYMPKPLKNSILYGGIYYDSDTTTMKHESERFTRGTEETYTSFASLNKDEVRSALPYLQGTKTEVEDIADKMKKKKISTTLYEGSQANEESFKALSGSDIAVLHIATHGFFLPTDKKLSGDQSLIQSGLLLSGANYAWQNKPLPEGIEDGILTAKEISFMDLRKTDLVVLSACQTALGEITGEGVFGLQRGFKKAGARTIIMSLWPVDDNATLLMMTEFYTNLTKGMNKREAFIAAQNKVKTTAGFENPRYWAAFIMLDGND